MKIDHLILGAYETNCYVLRSSETTKDCLIVDTGLEAVELIKFLQKQKLNPVAVVLTHGHIDHISGVAALRENFPEIKIYIHKYDEQMLTGAQDNLSGLTGVPFIAEGGIFSLEEGAVIDLADIKLDVLHTPGHTQGGICLYSRDEGIIFVGDTLFSNSVGRTDMPGGNMSQLIKGISEKLLILPDETIVYTGHGPVTTIAREKAHNPFLQK